MPQLFSNGFGKRNEMTDSDLKKYIDQNGRKGIAMIKNYASDLESSPSFCTEEHNGEGLYLGDSFTLTSEQSSVSQFGSQGWVELTTQTFEQIQNANNKGMIKAQYEKSYIPSLQSHESYNPSIQLLSPQVATQLSSQDMCSGRSEIKSSKIFVPEVKSLVQQLNLLENDLYSITREYLKMKTFCSAVIVSVKTLLSQEVGNELQVYMKKHLKYGNIEDPQIQSKQDGNSEQLPSKFLLEKLNSHESLHILEQQSRQMSRNVQEIFTLGSSRYKLDQNSHHQISPLKKSCNNRSVENTNKSFRKKTSQLGKQNNNQQTKPKDKKSYEKTNRKTAFKPLETCVNNIKNESMKFLVNNNSEKSTNASTPRNRFNFSTPQTSAVATELFCEVCQFSFTPNRFFQHLTSCCPSSQQISASSLKSTSKLAFNYTVMMEKLFDMRQQIEQQIELLSISKQKHKQKEERERMKRKLEQDLCKVTKIIEEKEKQMELHLSQNMDTDMGQIKQYIPSTNRVKRQR